MGRTEGRSLLAPFVVCLPDCCALLSLKQLSKTMSVAYFWPSASPWEVLGAGQWHTQAAAADERWCWIFFSRCPFRHLSGASVCRETPTGGSQRHSCMCRGHICVSKGLDRAAHPAKHSGVLCHDDVGALDEQHPFIVQHGCSRIRPM